MKAIVLQHIKIEDPGYIKDLMLADGWNLTTIELDEGDKIPKNLKKVRKVSLTPNDLITFEKKIQKSMKMAILMLLFIFQVVMKMN